MVRSRLSDQVRRVLVIAVCVIMTVFVVVYTLHKLTARVPAAILNYLHINTELAFAAWFNATLLLCIALLAGSLAYAASGRTRRAWSVVALATAYLSVDEATGLHEMAGGLVSRHPSLDIGSFFWVVPGVVAGVAGVVLLVTVTRPLEREVRRRLGVALAVYLAGALGVEIVTGLLIRTYAEVWAVVDVVQPALVVVEESLEMLACVYAIWALLRHLEDHPRARPRLPEPVPTTADPVHPHRVR